MKVLFDHNLPFMLAHGGLQLAIEKKFAALMEMGIEVDYVKWWDADQKGDLIHYFGRPSETYCEAAHGKNQKVVVTEILSGLGARPPLARLFQRLLISVCKRALPKAFTDRMAWSVYQHADAIVAITEYEAHLMRTVFRASPEKITVIPEAVDDLFFKTLAAPKTNWLLCCATITPQKRVLELAHAAVQAKVPVRFLGKPYSTSDQYYRDFIQFVSKNPDFTTHLDFVSDRHQLAKIYQEARGFVLLSTFEGLSLAALEATASGCPLLLGDLPWAHWAFADKASYCPITNNSEITAASLRRFYDAAPTLTTAPLPLSWTQVGQKLAGLYARLA